MAVTLTLRTSTTIPIEVDGITPEAVQGRSLAEIEKLAIAHGNAQHPLAEFFQVEGAADDATLVFTGDLSGVHSIGAKMSRGAIRVVGNAGRHVGSMMRGGELEVTGDVSDWLGGELHGGLIRVRGSAGNYVGAAYRGSPQGMTRGTILVHGSAGDEIGHTMRRGLIAIGGAAGDFVGFHMLAGTILVGGQAGVRHGACMRRGTIALLGQAAPAMLPGFRRACRFRPTALRLLWQELERLEFAFPKSLAEAEFDLFNGDFVEGGRGEILVGCA